MVVPKSFKMRCFVMIFGFITRCSLPTAVFHMFDRNLIEGFETEKMEYICFALKFVVVQLSVYCAGVSSNLLFSGQCVSFYLGLRGPGKLNNWRLECPLGCGTLE